MAEGQDRIDALVVGAGPAGLMAAEVLATAGQRVVVADAMPSPARKFLMAGKSGLNLTHDGPADAIAATYGRGSEWLGPMVDAFGPTAIAEWAEGLGQPVFTGSTGRVFPVAMKASPLLRAWLARLDAAGVTLRRRWRFAGWRGAAALFETQEGLVPVEALATILSMGGASWARLGTDGAWAEALSAEGVSIAPFAPSNTGLAVDWSATMARHFGTPIKGVALHDGTRDRRGEFVISRRGLEGGGIYAITPWVRGGRPIFLDLAPDLSTDAVAARLAKVRGRASLSNHLRKALKLSPAVLALMTEWARPLPTDPGDLARVVKALPVGHAGLRPLDEAISTVGGVPHAALDAGLMMRARPGVFCAGEMLDWDAPTGGYLLTACLATGHWAGLSALEWLTDAQARPPLGAPHH